MTPTHAQAQRRGALQSAVDAAALCTTGDPDAFFRADRESAFDWQVRRESARRVCAGCPALAACAELALRDGDGRATEDDMVRGGLSGPELAARRVLDANRLAAAVKADGDDEGARLDALTVLVTRTAAASPDRSGGHRAGDRAQAAQNTAVRELVGQVHEIRAARRARGGWGTAA
ncbi:WhiB family transcriptional regulator [Streptomyces sp. bgisy100]|uniref:WhiB family transcriptional regulator n=1 Tax=Streptomyces sp. bgisy100 TaxID=3413783 RepID=UPI003D7274F9